MIKRWLREPLLHFLVLGVALFVVDGYVHRGRGGVESSKEIALTLDDLRQLDVYFESQWRRPPTPEEFNRLVEDKVQEEVLYREALAMGLDKDDTIIKRRMAQKMQFLAEDVATAHEPGTEELKTWYAKNSEKFALPSRATFRHLFFSFDRRAHRARDDAAAALGKLEGEPEDSKLASSLADSFMFQDYYGERTPGELAKEFGPTFAQGLFRLQPKSWQGPIESGFGWHLVWIESIIPQRIPDFEEVEPDVKTAWLSEQKEQAWRKAYEAMRAKYTVLLPAPPDPQSTPVPAPPARKEAPAPSGKGAL